MKPDRAFQLLSCLLLAVSACAHDDACEDAAAKIAACFPGHAVRGCDPATAEAIASSTCEELAAADGKSDGCSWWTPWLCTTSSESAIQVWVDQCAGAADDCYSVSSASCALVTLHDASGDEVARGYSGNNGGLSFDGVETGDYTVKVHTRSGSLPLMVTNRSTGATAPASQAVTLERGGDAPRVDFNLVEGSAAAATQCADLLGTLTVRDSAGNMVDRSEVEWSWIVELELAGEVLERTRPVFIHRDSTNTDDNAMLFRMVRTGNYTLRFVRMDIPDYQRISNPDYDMLRSNYSANVAPIEASLRITDAQRGVEVSISRTIVDPL